MKRIRIKKMEGMFGRDETEDFEQFGLKVGDEINVKEFVGNAVWYQPIEKGDVLFIYTWNFEDVN
jgi:hypothetical protein